ncbi:hypothetical protein D3C81_476850 [compost metagenome]
MQRGFVGAVDSVFAVDARIATGTVVVDQQAFKTEVLVDDFVQLQQSIAFQRLMETLHQQLRAVAVDGQATGAFLAAMEQAIAIGALAVQLGEQILAMFKGGAQRLIQGRHAGRLAGGNLAREFNTVARELAPAGLRSSPKISALVGVLCERFALEREQAPSPQV